MILLGLGHPLGVTGARITTTLAHIIEKDNLKYGIAPLCIGGGNGSGAVIWKG